MLTITATKSYVEVKLSIFKQMGKKIKKLRLYEIRDNKDDKSLSISIYYNLRLRINSLQNKIILSGFEGIARVMKTFPHTRQFGQRHGLIRRLQRNPSPMSELSKTKSRNWFSQHIQALFKADNHSTVPENIYGPFLKRIHSCTRDLLHETTCLAIIASQHNGKRTTRNVTI